MEHQDSQSAVGIPHKLPAAHPSVRRRTTSRESSDVKALTAS